MNKLSEESSPYLKQHRNNPVDWHPWGGNAFETAKNRNCPIFLSIGYSTCYWCHVMEKDSFETDEVAKVLNANFVCIKVDREERPDVDAIYMDAVVAMTGHGGWPMSVFLAPDLKPFWGATFIPRDKFIQIATRVAEIWKESPDSILDDSKQILEALKHKKIPNEIQFDPSLTLNRACESLLKNFDRNYGGFGPAPKFPPSQQIMTLLLADKIFTDERFSYAALLTLEHIGRSALHDHIEGGFHRYATDEKWEIPHFEKMLYDNALLLSTFLDGYRHSGHSAFLSIAKKIKEYLFSCLSNNKMFSAAEDAGDVGKEGEFYSWEYEEFENLPLDAKEYLLKNFSVSEQGNFEHRNTLVCNSSQDSVADSSNNLYQLLKTIRDIRVRPHLDDKIIVSWNGLALSGLAKLYRFDSSDQQLLEAASKLAYKLLDTVDSNSILLHINSSDSRQIPAMLEDYAYLIEGLINLYQTSFDTNLLVHAYRLAKEQLNRLWDNEYKLFKSSTASELVSTKFEILDGALPSSNAVSYSNIKFLAAAFNDVEFYQIQSELFESLSVYAHKYPTGNLRFLRAAYDYQTQVVVISSTQQQLQQALEDLHNFRLQNPAQLAVFTSIVDNEEALKIPILFDKTSSTSHTTQITTYYVCSQQTCSPPVTDLDHLKRLLQSY